MTKRPSVFWAILRRRCPRCCRGLVFRGMFAMHEFCPVCRLRFEREPGYFLGAMYVSYPLSIVVMGLLIGLLVLLVPQWPVEVVICLAILPYLPLVPAVFRYSRIVFMHFDRWCNPSTFDEQYQPATTNGEQVREGP